MLAAWHQDSSATQAAGEFVGLFALDWQTAQIRIQSILAVPTRTHGLLVQPDGSPDGGFVLSCLRTNNAFQWSPKTPDALTVIAQLQDAGALMHWPLAQHTNDALLGSTRGVARWHPAWEPVFLKWPVGLALDNHWALVG